MIAIITMIATTMKIVPNCGNIPNAAPVLVIKVNLKSRSSAGIRLQDSPSGIFSRIRNLVIWSRAKTTKAIPIIDGSALPLTFGPD